MRDYTKIEAWKLADDLTVAVYEVTRSFPREEIYGLVSQIRRAAYSVPANIAEGSARGTQRDYLHFLYIARGSLTETQYFIHLAHRLHYLTGSGSLPTGVRCRDADLRSEQEVPDGRALGADRSNPPLVPIGVPKPPRSLGQAALRSSLCE